MAMAKLYGSTAWFLGSSVYGTSNKLAAAANGDTGTEFAESDSTLNDNTPHVLVGVRDAGSMKLYVDGVLQADTGTEANAITNGSDFLSVGCSMATSESTTAYHFSGKIGQPIIVNRKPTPGELADLHAYLMTWAGI